MDINGKSVYIDMDVDE